VEFVLLTRTALNPSHMLSIRPPYVPVTLTINQSAFDIYGFHMIININAIFP
jgi:hypothetical protein